MDSITNKQSLLRCSFCLKPQQEVHKLIAGPAVFICDACVDVCLHILEETEDPLVAATKRGLIKEIPTAFISYSWDDGEHRAWVAALGTRLRGDGIDLTLDEWHLHPGDQAPAFMENSIRQSDFVIIVCTLGYRQRSEGRKGGVGYEGNIITAEMLTSGNDRKFIPVLRQGEWAEAAASWLAGKIYVDLRGDPYSEPNYRILVSSIFGQLSQPPPIGASSLDAGTLEAGSVRVARERLYADLLNSAVRVSQATKGKRHLIKDGSFAAKALLESQVEPDLKQQAQRFMDLANRAQLVGSDDVVAAVKKLVEHVLLWQLSVWHPEGDSIYDKHFTDFNTASIPRLREAVRQELSIL